MWRPYSFPTPAAMDHGFPPNQSQGVHPNLGQSIPTRSSSIAPGAPTRPYPYGYSGYYPSSDLPNTSANIRTTINGSNFSVPSNSSNGYVPSNSSNMYQTQFVSNEPPINPIRPSAPYRSYHDPERKIEVTRPYGTVYYDPSFRNPVIPASAHRKQLLNAPSGGCTCPACAWPIPSVQKAQMTHDGPSINPGSTSSVSTQNPMEQMLRQANAAFAYWNAFRTNDPQPSASQSELPVLSGSIPRHQVLPDRTAASFFPNSAALYPESSQNPCVLQDGAYGSTGVFSRPPTLPSSFYANQQPTSFPPYSPCFHQRGPGYGLNGNPPSFSTSYGTSSPSIGSRVSGIWSTGPAQSIVQDITDDDLRKRLQMQRLQLQPRFAPPESLRPEPSSSSRQQRMPLQRVQPNGVISDPSFPLGSRSYCDPNYGWYYGSPGQDHQSTHAPSSSLLSDNGYTVLPHSNQRLYRSRLGYEGSRYEAIRQQKIDNFCDDSESELHAQAGGAAKFSDKRPQTRDFFETDLDTDYDSSGESDDCFSSESDVEAKNGIVVNDTPAFCQESASVGADRAHFENVTFPIRNYQDGRPGSNTAPDFPAIAKEQSADPSRLAKNEESVRQMPNNLHQAKQLLKDLNLTNSERVYNHLLSMLTADKSSDVLTDIIDMIFEKALDEPNPMLCANLCLMVAQEVTEAKEPVQLESQLLLMMSHYFQKVDQQISMAQNSNGPGQLQTTETDAERRFFANIWFIVKLCNLRLLPEKALMDCVDRVDQTKLASVHVNKLECLFQLIAFECPAVQSETSFAYLDELFQRLRLLAAGMDFCIFTGNPHKYSLDPLTRIRSLVKSIIARQKKIFAIRAKKLLYCNPANEKECVIPEERLPEMAAGLSIKAPDRLNHVVDLIFEKALNEPRPWLCATLCSLILEPAKDAKQKMTEVILETMGCHFEKMDKEIRAASNPCLSAEDSFARESKARGHKSRNLGFQTDLYRLELLPEKARIGCLERLLPSKGGSCINTNEFRDLLNLVDLLRSCGETIKSGFASELLDGIFEQLQEIEDGKVVCYCDTLGNSVIQLRTNSSSTKVESLEAAKLRDSDVQELQVSEQTKAVVPGTFEAITCEIRELLGSSVVFNVYWKDSDDDWVIVESDLDLQAAYDTVISFQKNNLFVRVNVRVKQTLLDE